MNIDQYRIYKIKTFSLFTDVEKAKHEEIYIEKNGKLKAKKKDKEAFQLKLAENELQRIVRKEDLTEHKQIAIFDNDLLRLIREDRAYPNKSYSLIQEVLFVEIYHEVILEQILKYGIKCFSRDYVFFTASSGQTRHKTITVVDKEFYIMYIDRLMNGLTVDRINKHGGINIGKYLAYLSLTMSAGIPTDAIDIERVIVVPDFSNEEDHEVELIDIVTIDNEDNEIKTAVLNKDIKPRPVKIEHADGAGMFLPGVLKKSCQIRAAWIKGALFEFDFRKFATEIAKNTKIKDVWGDTWDILDNDIQIILTASQVKMWKYYKDWKEYKDYFKHYNLRFVICNEANDPQSQTEVAYQFLQTLDRKKVDKSMIANLCSQSIDRIKKLHSDLPTVLNALGIKDCGDGLETIPQNLKPIQEALIMYPPLLQDLHFQETIKDTVRSYRKKAMAGKLVMDAFYSYLSPDWYAICQWLFQDIKKPTGLIPNGHVYNAYYNDMDINEVDVGRNPHLWNEHCIRTLIKSEDCDKWFKGYDTVVSCHDIISKTIQCDWDGDSCITITSPDWLKCVTPATPLYYEMFKAEPQQINSENQYKTLTDAFKANIGLISNSITNEWNKNIELPVDLDLIKVLVCYNNFTIDQAKTGSNIELIGEQKSKYSQLTRTKPPKFFRYAKNKKADKCSSDETSIVNRISRHIDKHTKNIPYNVFKMAKGQFDYGMLLNNSLGEVRRDTKQYKRLQQELFLWDKKINYLTQKLNQASKKDKELREYKSRFDILYHYCREAILEIYSDFDECVNAIIDIEYRQSYNVTKNKNILWGSFGDVVLNNLKVNLQSDIELKSRPRLAYTSEDKEIFEKQKQKIVLLDTPQSVNITLKDLETINTIKNTNDRNIFFVVTCLCKSFNNELTITASKKDKLTANKIDKLAGTTTFSAAIKRLEKIGLVRIESEKKKTVIRLVAVNQDDVAFSVENIWRPLFYLEKYNGKVVGNCSICGTGYIKKGNRKTCSTTCQTEQDKRSKQKNYVNRKKIC